MRVSSRVDYAVRACVLLALKSPNRAAGLTTSLELSDGQEIPAKYLESILGTLKRGGLIGSQRGAEGGYWLERPPAEISIADIIRVVEGPMAEVRGEAPENLEYSGPTVPLERVWLAVRASLRSVLEATTLQSILDDELPQIIDDLLSDPTAWRRRQW